MKKTKKFISILLSVLMLFSITSGLNFSAYAETSGDFEYIVNGTTAQITKYNGSDNNVVIPSVIDEYTVTTIGEVAFLGNTELVSITIPNSVTYIAPEAFRECYSLSSIIIPDSVEFIDFYVFSHCTNLKSLTISNSMTMISPCTFEYCGLESIVIPDSIQRICWDAFLGCNNLQDIYYTGSEEQWSIIDIDKEHYNSGDIVNDDNVSGNICFENATVHYNYVQTCSHINISSQVIQPTCTTGGYTLNTCTDCGYEYTTDETNSLGHLFENYTAVDSYNHKAICSRENCNVSNIESHSFEGDICEVCSCLSSDENYDYEYNILADKTVEITYYYGSGRNVVIPSTILGYPVVKIGGHSFDGLSNLTSISIPSSVTEIGTAAFTHCYNLSSITVDENNTVYDSRDNCNAIIKTSSNTLIAGCKNTIIPNGITVIGEEAFGGASGLTNIKIPNSVKAIEQYAFLDCSGLESIILPNISKIDSETFSYCTNLKSITIPNTVTKILDTFIYCENLTDIYYSGSEEQWNNIIGIKDIEAFQNATIHYNYVTDVPVDTTAYDDALAEANAIMSAPDYATKYLASSRTAYENAVNAAIKDDFASQEEVDSAASAIISAKSLLTYSQSTVEFYIVDENGNITNQISETLSYGDALTLNAGDYISDSDQITKWVAISGVNSYESKIATSQRSYTMVVTKPVKIYAHYVTISSEPTVKYSRITFISKNGAVVDVKYLKQGETLDTSTVQAPVIPFYEFIGWNKTSVTANGSDIFVKAMYTFIEVEENRCNVHYDSSVKSYAYDSFVYIYGAENKKLALSTDGTQSGIITYLDENAFYAPRCSDIYVIEVEVQNASIGITGSYSTSTDEYKDVAFNCKYFVPDDCTVIEYGLIASSEKGIEKIEGEKSSSRGEYCIKVTMAITSSVSLVYGQAYLTYKAADGELVTIYSSQVSQSV